jgi:small-conductance mechanosensitive channel
MRQSTWIAALLVAAIAMAHAASARAQDPEDTGTSEDAGAPQDSPSTPLGQEVSDATRALQDAEATAAPSPDLDSVRGALDRRTEELAALAQATTPEALDLASRNHLVHLERQIDGVDTDLAAHEAILGARTEELTELRGRLDEESRRWSRRRRDAASAPGTAPATLQRLDTYLSDLDELITKIDGRLEATAELEGAAAEQRTVVDAAQTRVHDALAAHRARILSRVSPPIWGAFADASAPAARVDPEGVLDAFVALYGNALPAHALLFLLFLATVVGLGRWARASGKGDDDDTAVLARPIAAAFMVALVTLRFIYPRAPSAFFNAAGILALLSLVRLLPALIEDKQLHRPLWALFGIFALRQVLVFVPLTGGMQRVSNLVLTLLLLAWAVFVLRRGALRESLVGEGIFGRTLRVALMATGVALALSSVAEVFGYTNLSDLLTSGLLVLIYVFFLLLAAVRVLDAVVSITLVSKVAHFSRAARLHSKLIEQKIIRLFYFLAGLGWLYGALLVFEIDKPVLHAAGDALGAEVTVGSWSLSIGDVLSFLLVLWATRHVARAVVFMVEQDVLPRLSLPRGAPANISRLVGYAIWALGFLVAVGAAGVDMSSVALLVSALGVGIGFGLQNVVNNFVSGLILIFERPIRVGDVVEVGGMVARVEDIGIRASIVRTYQGAEVIVPNADLVSAQVINWTLSDQQRRIEIPVGVAYGTDPQRVIDILRQASINVEEILQDPEPACLFIGFGESSLDFELRFWLKLDLDWPAISSRTLVEIHRLLAEAKIEIPFPQRDLHVRTVSPKAASLMAPKS